MSETPNNVIYIGKKGPMAYVLGAITQFSNGNNEVHIRARGNAISRAVDVAEIIRRRFLKDIRVKNIEISTEERETEDRGKLNISTISICLSK